MQFRDLNKQYGKLKTQIDEAVSDVIVSSRFISGPQVSELERQLAEYVGVKHCVSCANGTDALTLALMTWNIGEGDAVFVPDFTFFSSGESPAIVGATPIFVDVDKRTFNIDSEKLEQSINEIIQEGILRPRVVVAVDLFGLPADYLAIKQICKKYSLLLLEDGAQGFGGSIKGKKACSFGDISTTSFFPAKPLGCYGDGGAIFTDNDEWAATLKSLTVHGKSGNDKYNNDRIGMNSRLDTIQAAILLAKLKAFKECELDSVNQAAQTYTKLLENTNLILPYVPEGYLSSWAQYTVQLPDIINRKEMIKFLKAKDIPSMVYYPKPMHLQGAFACTRSATTDCTVAEKLCNIVLSLPMHPYLEKSEIANVVETIKSFL